MLSVAMKIVKKDSKRWCPYCNSNKWEFLEAVQVTPEILQQYLLVKYRCLKCNKEFLAEEGVKSKYVDSADECFHCQSRNIEKISKEGADIELYRCRQCHGYMAIKQDE